MSDFLDKRKAALESWGHEALKHELLPTSVANELSSIRTQSPSALFDSSDRPLVAGLFGGTGVGKSTLLNRLAGSEIARTSVERPTSREVTLYHHSSVKLQSLPDNLPTDKVHTATHENPANRHILWIDMPDFDSVESANRALVDDWLPHIDLLLYIVSPERYRDDNGWRLLLSRVEHHAWIFVINHWDRGHTSQRADFHSLLQQAGLADPVIFCTDSSPEPVAEDQFAEMQSLIQSIADNNTIRQLEQRGLTVRQREISSLLQQAEAAMGPRQALGELRSHWKNDWQRVSASLASSLEWKYPVLADKWHQEEPGLLPSLLKALPGPFGKSMQSQSSSAPELPFDIPEDIFDDSTMQQINDDLDELIQQAQNFQAPSAAIRKYIDLARPQLADHLNQEVELALKSSLSNPGTSTQRGLARLLAWVGTILPIAALGWVGYRIISAFSDGANSADAYLGTGFIINAALLILLAWGVPWFLHRKIKPTSRQAALRGYQQGTRNALRRWRDDIDAQLRIVDDIRSGLAIQAEDLQKSLETRAQTPETSGPLSRLLTPTT